MPTVLRWNGHRFYFFSNESDEPPHIHVDKGGATAKIWLRPVRVARSIGYAAHELTALTRKVEAEREAFEKAWHDYFGD